MKNIVLKTVKVLEKAGVILYPTDTIWGIGCDATNDDAVASVFRIKQRDEHKSMLILVDSLDMLEKYVDHVPEIASVLVEANEKPLTIIYPKAKNVSQKLVASDGSIGIRIVNNEFCRELIKEFKKPIVSTSANFANMKNPLGFFDIDENLKMAVDYIVPLQQEQFSTYKSSDIIKIDQFGHIKLVR